jgi:hypothetical protein
MHGPGSDNRGLLLLQHRFGTVNVYNLRQPDVKRLQLPMADSLGSRNPLPGTAE